MPTIMEKELEGVDRRDRDYNRFFDGLFLDVRREFIYKFGFPIITDEAVQFIMKYGNRFVDVGCGNGYLTFELRNAGADCVALDASLPGGNKYRFGNTWVDDIQVEPAERALPKMSDRTAIMSWPCYDDDWCANALMAYKGDTLVYIGEGAYGCTGTAEFHELLDLEWERIDTLWIPQWESIHDRIEIYRRK